MNSEMPATVLLIFGITGDLSRRYLLPALAQIKAEGQAGPGFKIIGITRRDIAAEAVLDEASRPLADCLSLFKLDYSSTADFQRLGEAIQTAKHQLGGNPQVVFHLSVPPDQVPTVVERLSAAGLNRDTKLLMEKPYGRDLASARDLIQHVSKCFADEQVYRIDHYLAKEMAQNVAVFLGGNAVFREVWDADHIEKIEFISSESISIEGRIHFYEQTGALRDFVQSHLLQLVALTLMDPCEDFSDLQVLPGRRLAVLKQLQADPSKAVRGQYQGYKEEVANPSSQVETFVWLELSSDNPRWRGVPLLLATGKKLDDKLTEIRVHFKKVGGSMGNVLTLRIQPREGIEFGLWVKRPGPGYELDELPLSFAYHDHFERLPDAYEQVLIDAMRGDHSLFASSQEVLVSWEVLQPVLDAWQKDAAGLIIYKPGSQISDIIKD